MRMRVTVSRGWCRIAVHEFSTFEGLQRTLEWAYENGCHVKIKFIAGG